MPTSNKYSLNKMLYIALLVAQALIIFMVEQQIPFPLPIPGAKYGLANIFSVIALYTMDFSSALMVVVLRVVISVLVAKSLSSIFFAMTGALLSFIVMYLMKKYMKDRVSLLGVSITGALFHNLGQVIAAIIQVSNLRMLTYLPPLSIVAIPTGLFVGLTASFIIEHISKLPLMKKINMLNKN